MNKTTKKAVIGGAVLCTAMAAACAATYFGMKQLVSVALDRQKPKTKVKTKRTISGSEASSEMPDGYYECADRLEACTEKVETISHDGIRLVAHWYPCENAKRNVIAVHGWRSSWLRDFALSADFVHKSGCNVLYIEQRGQGNSEGEYMGFGLIERYDCLDWIRWINDNVGSELPIYLMGVSMGAATVLMASGFDLPDNVHGIIADCGYTSPHAIWKHVLERNLRIPYTGVAGAIADDLCRKKINMGTKAYSAVEALRSCNVPVLFIHGTDDKFVPIEMTYENYKACAAPKRLFVVPGADHAVSYLVDKVGYEETVRNFWHDYDVSCIC